MYIPITLAQGTAWTQHGAVVSGTTDEVVEVFHGIQADLNFFADKLGFALLKVDGLLGPKTLAAIHAVEAAVTKANPTLQGTLAPQADLAAVATQAVATRTWLEGTARSALGIGDRRKYHRGHGKEWNVKDQIAYGAGPVHADFEHLQADLNKFAEVAGFEPLEVDGFLGAHTAAAVKAVYDAVVKKKPFAAMTPFPVPDTKEEVAEYCMFIRGWLHDVAGKTIGRAEA